MCSTLKFAALHSSAQHPCHSSSCLKSAPALRPWHRASVAEPLIRPRAPLPQGEQGWIRAREALPRRMPARRARRAALHWVRLWVVAPHCQWQAPALALVPPQTRPLACLPPITPLPLLGLQHLPGPLPAVAAAGVARPVCTLRAAGTACGATACHCSRRPPVTCMQVEPPPPARNAHNAPCPPTAASPPPHHSCSLTAIPNQAPAAGSAAGVPLEVGASSRTTCQCRLNRQ
jgi:hypothetical protein